MTIYVVLETNYNRTRPIAVYYEETKAVIHADNLGYSHDQDPVGSIKKMEVL
jgi:hypothetical protein